MSVTSTTTTERVEIDFSIYNPFDPEFVKDPYPVFDRLIEEYPVAYHTDLRTWLVSRHDLATALMRDSRFSTRYEDWKYAPPPKPESEWNLYDRCTAQSVLTVGQTDHQRLRRLTAPAFSRRVMDQIETAIGSAISDIFDQIPDPRLFNYATEVSAKVPMRAISRIVGVSPGTDDLFENGLGANLLRAANPLFAADHDTYVQRALAGLEFMMDTITERRRRDNPGDDFIGTLVGTVIDGESLSDIEILSLIMSLVVAGADTTVDTHTYVVWALLNHPDQRWLLRERPELTQSTVLEAVRWSAGAKLAAIPRFPIEDVEIGGQVLEQKSLAFCLFGAAWIDPAKWPDPHRFDITRNQAGNIIFGSGPHMCIGLNLVHAQAKLVLEEFERRFGDTARIEGGLEYDPSHITWRRITKMMIATGGSNG